MGGPTPLAVRALAVLGTAVVLLPSLHCNPDPNGAFREISKQVPAGCCREFRVGYDMTITDFGVDPSLRAPYSAFAQAMGDYAAASTRLLDEVTGACRNLALDFGASDDDATVKGRTGEEASFAWCNLAVRQLHGAFADVLQVCGHFNVKFAAGDCFVDSTFQARCEQTCASDPNCAEKGIDARCGKSDLVGLCAGKCTGACLGSASVPGACEGKCDGKCEGTCLGDCNGLCDGVLQPGGRCRGACLGICDGFCKGRCTSECHFTKTASSRCDTECLGGCSVPYKALKCDADLGPPTCQGDADCQTNCRAIAQVRAACTSPSVAIGMSQDIFNDVTVESDIRSLELNLPKLFSAAQGRGPQLEAEARAAMDGGEKIVADKVKVEKGKLGIKGTACAIVMQAAGEQALQNLHTAIQGAKSVLATIPPPR
jgi:hypothetical protein